MATVIVVAGVDVALADDESFNKVRHRVTNARRMLIDYELGNITAEDFQPFHELSFKSSDGGRVFLPVDKIVFVHNDKPKD